MKRKFVFLTIASLMIISFLFVVYWPSYGDASPQPGTTANRNVVGGEAGTYLIGAAIYDITGPSAALGMAGYVKKDQLTTGIHMRLRSRSFVIGDPTTGKRVVFVSADLAHMYQAVKQQVSKLVARDNELKDFYNDSNILLSATHTHSSPGGYSHYPLYNLIIPGLDRQNFNTIVNGIYQSIKKAHHNVTPGKIFIHTGEVQEAGFNRSEQAYNNNPQTERDRYSNNIDKTMTTLRLVARDGTELGMLGWFAVHPTNVGNTNTLITGDNFGYAAYLFERDKNTDYLADKTFVGAFAQSNSGDVSPNIWGYPNGKDDYQHMEIIGERLYQKAKELFEEQVNGEPVKGIVDFRHSYVNMTNHPIKKEWIPNADRDVTTCPPAIGLSVLAGSTEDGKGIEWFYEGMVRDPANGTSAPLEKCHAEKPILTPTGAGDGILLLLKILLGNPPWTPEVVPVQILRIGSLAIVGVPFESTTMAGRRLRDTVLEPLRDVGVTRAVIAGLSNTYSGYVTTREEYAKQNYEGASVLFGPYTLNAYQQEFDRLATAMAKGLPVETGPIPEDRSKKVSKHLVSIPLDTIPTPEISNCKKSGDVESNVKAFYHLGETVSVTFCGGDPRNDLKIQDTYLTVEKLLAHDSWKVIARDWDPETKYRWNPVLLRDGRTQSKITVEWTVPANVKKGTYRIRQFGNWRSGNGVKPYTGSSRWFSVQ